MFSEKNYNKKNILRRIMDESPQKLQKKGHQLLKYELRLKCESNNPLKQVATMNWLQRYKQKAKKKYLVSSSSHKVMNEVE